MPDEQLPTCFVIMPITTQEAWLSDYADDADHFLHVGSHLFKPAIERAGYRPIFPSVEGSEVIHAAIVKNLIEADMVLCDMSRLNPNVFFELGIRTALNRSVAMVRDDLTTAMPFDTSPINYFTYRNDLHPWISEPQIETLATHIKSTAERGQENALWRIFSINQQAKPTNIDDPMAEKLDLLAQTVDGLAHQIANIDGPGARTTYIGKPQVFNVTSRGGLEPAEDLRNTGSAIVRNFLDKVETVAQRREATVISAQTIGDEIHVTLDGHLQSDQLVPIRAAAETAGIGYRLIFDGQDGRPMSITNRPR